MTKLLTIRDFYEFVSKKYSNPKALNGYRDNAWQSYSTQEYLQEIKHIAVALRYLGIKKGDRVALMAPSSPEWIIIDLAIMATGAITIPLFPNISKENYQFIVNQTSIKTIFIGSDTWDKYDVHAGNYKTVINIDSSIAKGGAISYREMIALGAKTDSDQPDLFNELLRSSKPDDLAKIIYTSGSTGIPKGAMHSHEGVFGLLNYNMFNWDPKKDRFVSVLPLAHIYGISVNMYMLVGGVDIYYYNDLKNLSAAFKEIQPTLTAAVPRLLEKIYSKMRANVQNASFLKRMLGLAAFNLANNEHPSFWKKILHPIFDLLVYSKLRKALGNELRVVISGGAALDPHLNHFFLEVGIPIYEGYGLSEGCPVTMNNIEKRKVGSIGTPLEGMSVKTSAQGEILIHGSNVMKGYYKNPELSAQAIDSENWLHSGDQGVIDENGFVTIIGRLKELFKTSTGEMIAPVPIEHSLNKALFIETSVVIGDQRKFVSCLIVPDFEILKAMKAKQNLQHLSDSAFLETPYIKDQMDQLITSINQKLNYWEQIRAYRFIPFPITVENGELTPSMKIVRKMIDKRYKDLIDSMYEESDHHIQNVA